MMPIEALKLRGTIIPIKKTQSKGIVEFLEKFIIGSLKNLFQ